MCDRPAAGLLLQAIAPPFLLAASRKVGMIRKMRFIFPLVLLITLPLQAADKLNVLLICVDDLRPELNCYGADYIQSPNIDALASTGRIFRRHYVQAPTCGASRFTLLTGRYGGSNNEAIARRGDAIRKGEDAFPPSMPAWFRQNGYTTVSVGKVSHHPGGLGGKNWNDPEQTEMPNSWDRNLLPFGPWQHPSGWMHGLANGEIRGNPKDMDVFQSLEGPDTIYPDGPNTELALEQLELLAKDSDEKPFFLAFGILRPHLPFGAPARYLHLYEDVPLPPIPHPDKPEGKTTWHNSGEFMKYNRWNRDPNEDEEFATEVRRHYAACVSYADAQVGKMLNRLDELGLRDDTAIVLWGDHGWHLGEFGVWGKHTLFEESLRSPLIVSYPGMPLPGESTDAMVETIDVFPTLTELSGVPHSDDAQGVSLKPILDDPKAEGHEAFSYHRRNQTVRTETHRLVVHDDGITELYDHESPEGETRNIAEDHPDLVTDLTKRLNERLVGLP